MRDNDDSRIRIEAVINILDIECPVLPEGHRDIGAMKLRAEMRHRNLITPIEPSIERRLHANSYLIEQRYIRIRHKGHPGNDKIIGICRITGKKRFAIKKRTAAYLRILRLRRDTI